MLEIKNLSKIYYPKKGKPVTALDDVSLDIADKGLVFLLGKSGSGKSTLLNLLGGLDSYTSGDIIIKGKSTKNFKQSGFDSYRNTFIGFIFQEFNILEEYSVGQNIGMALELQHKKADKDAINNILKQVDLEDYFNRKPNELSGGQKQRVAIARALVKEPEIIMADEPTGALDSKTGKLLFETLKKISKNKLVIVVTHDRENAEIFGDRVIELADGKIIADRTRTNYTKDNLNQNVAVIDDKLIKIKAGKKIEVEDLEKINELLANSRDDAYISLEDMSDNKFSKKVSKILDGNSTVFSKTKDNIKSANNYPSNLKFVKSRLPSKECIKMGFSNLKHKKIRLVFTILLSFIAFFMSGLFTMATLFDKNKSETSTVLKYNYDSVLVQYLGGKYEYPFVDYENQSINGFTEEQLNELEKLSGNKPITIIDKKEMSFSNNLADYNDFDENNVYYNTWFKKFAIIESEETAGLKKIGNSRLPIASNEIAISDYTAASFIKYNYIEKDFNNESVRIEINKPEDMIGKILYIYDLKLTVTGVYETDFYKNRLKNLQEKFSPPMYSSLFDFNQILMGMCYVSPLFDTVSNDRYYLNKGTCKINSLDDTFHTTLINLNNISYLNLDDSESFIYSSDIDMTGNKIILSYYNAASLIPSFAEMINNLQTEENYNYNDLYKTAWNALPKEQKRVIIDFIPKEGSDTFLPLEVEVAGIYFENIFSEELYNFIVEKDKEIENQGIIEIENTGISPDNHNLFFSQLTTKYYNQNINNLVTYWGEGVTPRDLKDDEIIVSSEILWNKNGTKPTRNKFRELFDNLENYDAIWGISFDYYDRVTELKKFKIAGIHFNDKNIAIVNNNNFELFNEMKSRPRSALIQLTDNEEQNKIIFNYINSCNTNNGDYYEKLTIVSHLYSFLDTVDKILIYIKDIFLYVSLTFFVFSCLMFINFISLSIVNKKKEIGILRAIGARGSDVFRIFFAEGMAIGIINFLISALALTVTFLVINSLASMSLFVFSIYPYLIMAVLCFLSVFLSTYLTVRKISSKKPIDAINNR